MAVSPLVGVNRTKQVFFIFLLLSLAGFFIYTQWFAPQAELRFIGSRNLDKIAHIMGGMFIAGFFEWRSRKKILWQLLLLLLVAAVGWEVFEFFFDPKTQYFAAHSPDLWRLDTIGDIIAGFLGCYGYWVFAANRTQNPSA